MALAEKTASGLVIKVSSRRSKDGSWAHSITLPIGRYTYLSEESYFFVEAGDRVSFTCYPPNRAIGLNVIDPDSLSVLENASDYSGPGGYLYVLANTSMPRLVKVGHTTREPEVRARELSGTTGVPTPFTVEYALFVRCDASLLERAVHLQLETKRHGKEFFRVSVQEAAEAIKAQYGIIAPHHVAAQDAALRTRLKQREDERRRYLEAREARLAKQRLEASPEYRWLEKGQVEITIHGFLPQNIRHAIPDRSWMDRLLRKQIGPEFLSINILASVPRDGNEVAAWVLDVCGMIRGRALQFGRGEANFKVGPVNGTHRILQEAISHAHSLIKSYPSPRSRIVVGVQSRVLIDPQVLPGEVFEYTPASTGVKVLAIRRDSFDGIRMRLKGGQVLVPSESMETGTRSAIPHSL